MIFDIAADLVTPSMLHFSPSINLQLWEASTNLRFRRTHSPSVADIRLDFYSGVHGEDEPVGI